MQKFQKSILGALALSAIAVSSPALAQGATIGFLGGFTGPIESLTPPIFDGASLAVSHVNAQGGIVGGELSIVSGDTTCADATAAANAAAAARHTHHPHRRAKRALGSSRRQWPDLDPVPDTGVSVMAELDESRCVKQQVEVAVPVQVCNCNPNSVGRREGHA